MKSETKLVNEESFGSVSCLDIELTFKYKTIIITLDCDVLLCVRLNNILLDLQTDNILHSH